jgi:hypothetical protein
MNRRSLVLDVLLQLLLPLLLFNISTLRSAALGTLTSCSLVLCKRDSNVRLHVNSWQNHQSRTSMAWCAAAVLYTAQLLHTTPYSYVINCAATS